MHKLFSKLFSSGSTNNNTNNLASPINAGTLHPTLCSLFETMERQPTEPLQMQGISEKEVKLFANAFKKGEMVIGLSPAMAYALLCNYLRTMPEPVFNVRNLQDCDNIDVEKMKSILEALPPAHTQFLFRLFGIVVHKLTQHSLPAAAHDIFVEEITSCLCTNIHENNPPSACYDIVNILIKHFHIFFPQVDYASTTVQKPVDVWVSQNTPLIWGAIFCSSAMTLQQLADILNIPEHTMRYILANIHNSAYGACGSIEDWESAADFFLNAWNPEEIASIVGSFQETRGLAMKMIYKVPSKTLRQIRFFLRMITKTDATREEYLYSALKSRSFKCKSEEDIEKQFRSKRIEEDEHQQEMADLHDVLNKVASIHNADNKALHALFAEAQERTQRIQQETQLKQQEIQQRAYVEIMGRTPRRGLGTTHTPLEALVICGNDIPPTPTLNVSTPLRGRSRSNSNPSPLEIYSSYASRMAEVIAIKQEAAPYPTTPTHSPEVATNLTVTQTTSFVTPAKESHDDSDFVEQFDSKPKVSTSIAARTRSAKKKLTEKHAATDAAYDTEKNRAVLMKLNLTTLRSILAAHNKKREGSAAQLRRQIIKAKIDCAEYDI